MQLQLLQQFEGSFHSDPAFVAEAFASEASQDNLDTVAAFAVADIASEVAGMTVDIVEEAVAAQDTEVAAAHVQTFYPELLSAAED